MLMSIIVKHEFSRILPCLSPHKVNYVMMNRLTDDARFKERFQQILENDNVDFLLASSHRPHRTAFGTRAKAVGVFRNLKAIVC